MYDSHVWIAQSHLTELPNLTLWKPFSFSYGKTLRTFLISILVPIPPYMSVRPWNWLKSFTLKPSNSNPKIIIDPILSDLQIKPGSIGDGDTRTSPAAVEADTIGTIFKTYNFGIEWNLISKKFYIATLSQNLKFNFISVFSITIYCVFRYLNKSSTRKRLNQNESFLNKTQKFLM